MQHISDLASAFAQSQSSRRAVAINAIIAGLAMVFLQPGTMSVISENGLPVGPSSLPPEYRFGILFWSSCSLITLGFIVLRRGFVTGEIKDPKCHFCGQFMITVMLACPYCNSKSRIGE